MSRYARRRILPSGGNAAAKRRFPSDTEFCRIKFHLRLAARSALILIQNSAETGFCSLFKCATLKFKLARKAAAYFKARLAAEKSTAFAALASAEKPALAASRLVVLLLCLIEAIYASGVGAWAFIGGLALALVGWVVK